MCRRKSLNISKLRPRLRAALREDIGKGDITSGPLFPLRHNAKAVLIAKGAGIIAGLDIAGEVCSLVDRKMVFTRHVKEGALLSPGDTIVTIKGPTISILKAERTLLNFLQHLSGIATLTARFVSAVKSSRAKILDTRKTTPRWRDIEKYAVLVGGGKNHRFGLYDAVLLKDNHIAAAGGITNAVTIVRDSLKGREVFIEVETKDLREVREAHTIGVDRIMLDNMTPGKMKEAVSWLKKQPRPLPQTEASGNVTLKTIGSIAQTGVDFISIGSLTHSPGVLDISLLII
jgi:nicotinate-nucleotide pyrophosphorylase (carboxylating)